MIVLSLPMPPSLNNAFKNLKRGGRAPSKLYQQWQEEAGYAINRQAQNPVVGPVAVEMVFGKARSDLDNRPKGVLDLLVKHRLIEDDSPRVVRKLVLSLDDTVTGCRVVVRHAG